MFQYKILNNLFFNKLLFKLKKVPSPLCSFCNSTDETLLHIFYTCHITKRFWNKLQYFVSQYFFLGIFNIGNQLENFLLIDYLQLIFKHNLHMSREHGAVCFNCLKLYFIKIKTIHQNISPYNSQKKEKCRRKWRVTENILK